jgi:hypothetical protein
MAFELILQDIELADNTINDNTFDIWFCKRLNRFLAQENIKGGRKFVYELKDSEENIATNHRQEILEYRLGRVTRQDQVTIADIFMHRKFIEKR